MIHNKRIAAGYVPGFNKTYLNRAMTRAMSAEHPIGDPHGGAAYGERNDPISAAISIATLVGTGGAVMAGTASLMTGLAFAGAALSLVGNITGNKTLSQIGMVANIAGGIGSLAESAGMFSTGTMGEMFGYGEAAAGAGAGAGAPLAQTPEVMSQTGSASIMSDAAAAPMVDVGGVGQITPELTPNLSASPASINTGAAAPAGASDALSQSLPGVSAPTAPGAPMAGAGTGVAAPAAPMAPEVPSPFTSQTPTGLATLPGDSAAAAQPGILEQFRAGNVWEGIKGIGSSFMDLTKSNPGAAYMLGQAVSSVGDVASGKAGAQIDALEAQGQLSKAQADKLRFEMEEYKRKIAQRNSNYTNVANPLTTWKPNFQTTSTAQPGLVTGAMQQPTSGG